MDADDHRFASLDDQVREVRRDAADAAWLLVLAATVLVLSLLPWFRGRFEAKTETFSLWDVPDAASLLLLLAVLATVVGPAVLVRSRSESARQHLLVAAPAFLITLGCLFLPALSESQRAIIPAPAFYVSAILGVVLGVHLVRRAARIAWPHW